MYTQTVYHPGKEAPELTIIINKDGYPEGTDTLQGLYVDLYTTLPLPLFLDLRQDFINHPLQDIHPSDVANPAPDGKKKERLYFYFFILGHGDDKVTFDYTIHTRTDLRTRYAGELPFPDDKRNELLSRLRKRCKSPEPTIVNGKIGLLFHWNNW